MKNKLRPCHTSISGLLKTNLMQRLLLLLLLLCCNQQFSFGQEVLSPLPSNPTIKKYLTARVLSTNALDTISLPFRDDFSNSFVVPNARLWTDRHVFINTDMADSPPTLGVATFDGLDQNGDAYDILSPTASGLTDVLSSQAINLSTRNRADSIYLSFMFQPAGLCDPPESNDSLTVAFFKQDSTWEQVWSTYGSPNVPFRQVMIGVLDSSYFHAGFRFRFSSYGNLTGNVDVWHLDYVRLAANRSAVDTGFTDVGFKTPPSSLMKIYQELPLRQLRADSARFLAANHRVTARNLGSDRNVGYKYSARHLESGNTLIDIGFRNISPFVSATDVTFTFASFPLPLSGSDSLTVETSYLIQNNPDFVAANDTARRLHRFWNHYAYDDGTAETGYGLNIIGGSIAYKFYVATPDTLRGIWMYFTQAAENAALELFNLNVWSFIGEFGFSGNESRIAQQTLLRPQYADSIGEFIYYALDTPVVVRDSFYVGWQQATNKLLNIGFDRNHDVPGTKWFNVQGQWNPTQFSGSWMIRPVVGAPLRFPTQVQQLSTSVAKIYPNPAADWVNIEAIFQIERWELRSIHGALVKTGVGSQERINVADISPGLYILQLTGRAGQHAHAKLIVRH